MTPDVKVDASKAGAAWGMFAVSELLDAAGIQTWGDAAALAAFLYSCLLIGEWVWKRFFKKPKVEAE